MVKTLQEWRNLRIKEKELDKLQARAEELPTVAGPTSALQIKVRPELERQKSCLKQELERAKMERACLRARSACDLLKQGEGGFGTRRLPINPSAEPFVHNAILSAANRATAHLFLNPLCKIQTIGTLTSKPTLNRRKGMQNIASVIGRAWSEDIKEKLDGDEVVNIDADNGFSIMLRITTKKFIERLRMVSLADWHNHQAEKAAALDGLPRFNHEILPLLCWMPGSDARLQVRLPTTIIIRGSTCTNFIENTELDYVANTPKLAGIPAEGLVWEFLRVAPSRQWRLSHGCFIAKRLHVDGSGEPLQYVTPAVAKSLCCRDCVPQAVWHKQHILGSFSTTAMPHTREDLDELLKSLKLVQPDTVTVLQRFVPCHGGRAQVMRVVREVVHGETRMRRFLLTNRNSYNEFHSNAHSAIEDCAEVRLAIALEQANSARRVEITELTPVGDGVKYEETVREGELEATKLAKEQVEEEWGETKLLADNIYSLLCHRGKRGREGLRDMVLKSEIDIEILKIHPFSSS